MLNIEKIKNCTEYKNIISNYDFNHLDRSMFLYEQSRKAACIYEIYDFVYKFKYTSEYKTIENETIIIELINQTDRSSVKSILLENLVYKDEYINQYINVAVESINELLQFLPNANTFAPSNRIEDLILKLKEHLDTKDFKDKLNNIFSTIKSFHSLMNKYFARIFYKIATILQDMNMTSKDHYDYAKDIIDFAFSRKPLDLSEFEIYEQIFDFAKLYTTPKNTISLQLASYIYANLDLMHYIIKQQKLEKAVRLVSDCSSDQVLINKYKLELDKANEEVLGSVQSHSIPLGKELEESVKKNEELIRDTFACMTSMQSLLTIFFDIKIIASDDIKKQSLEIRKNSFMWDTIPVVLIDAKHGKTIKTDNSAELASSNRAFNILLQTSVSPLMQGFINTFDIDQEVDNFIEQMIDGNPICRTGKKKTVKKAIIGILKKDFSTNLSNLISSFEDGLRLLFENSGISTTEFVRGHQSKIDMNDIFRVDSDNIYQNKLLEYLTDDMFSLLHTLSVGSNGYNIRNRVMHGEFDDDDYMALTSIYFAYLIIICYFGFYCNKN